MKLKKLLKICPDYMEVFIHGEEYPPKGCQVVDAILTYPFLDAKVKKITSMAYVTESSDINMNVNAYLDIDISRSV